MFKTFLNPLWAQALLDVHAFPDEKRLITLIRILSRNVINLLIKISHTSLFGPQCSHVRA